MKNYVAMFESFEEGYDDFYQKPNVKSDSFYHKIASELIELANQYSTQGVEMDPHSEKYGTPSRIKDLQNDLITMIYDTDGEEIAQQFADESDSLLAKFEIAEKAHESMSKEKIFAQTDNIPDNGILQKSTKNDNVEKAKTPQRLRPRKTSRH
jgi:hypothetical protein